MKASDEKLIEILVKLGARFHYKIGQEVKVYYPKHYLSRARRGKVIGIYPKIGDSQTQIQVLFDDGKYFFSSHQLRPIYLKDVRNEKG